MCIQILEPMGFETCSVKVHFLPVQFHFQFPYEHSVPHHSNVLSLSLPLLPPANLAPLIDHLTTNLPVILLLSFFFYFLPCFLFSFIFFLFSFFFSFLPLFFFLLFSSFLFFLSFFFLFFFLYSSNFDFVCKFGHSYSNFSQLF